MGEWKNEEKRKAYYRQYNEKRRAQNSAYQTLYRARNLEMKRLKDREYAAAHREEAKTRSRAWYYANKDYANAANKARYDPAANREYQKKYRTENADKLRERDRLRSTTQARKDTQRRTSKKHSAKIVARVKAWVKANPERARTNSKNTQGRRHARIQSRPVESIDPMEVYRANDGICGLCGKPVSEKAFEIDHIVPIAKGGGHVRINVHIAHRACNKKKGASLDAIIYSL